jgi:histidyl-tRNA synthetase
MLLLLEAVGSQPAPRMPDVYAIVPAREAMPTAIAACEALRDAGVEVLMHGAGAEAWGSMKSQFKRADASGARHALIFGADELTRGEVAVKPLRGGGEQRTRPLADIAAWATELRDVAAQSASTATA